MMSENSGNSKIAISDNDLYDWIEHERHVPPEKLDECLSYVNQKADEGEKISLAQALVEKGILPPPEIERIARGQKAARALQIPGYEIIGLLGTGAMAMVFRGRQTRLDRIVAIKILPQKLSQDAEFVRLFRAEGRAAAKLNHPNIVQAIDVAEAGGRHFFIMEYVEGHPLHDELEQGKIFSEVEALEIIIQVASALEHAHAQGIIHRDVKPKNIMITPERVCKLADMGLARLTKDQQGILAERGRTIGTPFYISPEQIRGNSNVDFRADIYSLGATLYHLVTGRMPFEGDSEKEIMEKHLYKILIPPDHINTSLSNGLGEVVEVMMAKSPDNRYSSTSELLLDLKAIVAGEPPLQARKRFRSDVLNELDEAESIPFGKTENSEVESEAPQTNNAIIVLAVALILSIMLNILLIVWRN